MLAALQTVGWISCVVYATIPSFWLVIHSRADYWRSRRRSPYRVLLPMWMAMWIVLGLITAPWRRVSLYETAWTWIPALLLFISGLSIYISSAREFSGTLLGGLPEVLPEHREQRLVTSGIRSRVRHPVYLGHLCEMLAWCIATGLVVCWALAGFAVASGAIMIRSEDKELELRFGEKYIKYRERVPAVMPSLRI
jgi:protein-S-isoprenylcysteine O-methyltransferase Ste14